MHTLRRLLLPSALVLVPVLLVGCGGDDHWVKVHGDVVVGLADYDTGFRFDRPVRLAEPETEPATVQTTIGECVVNDRGVRVALERVLPEGDNGVTFFEVRLPATGAASVSAEIAGRVYAADDATDADCALTALYSDIQDGVAGVSAACSLYDPDGDVAIVDAELHFTGCRFE